MLLNIFEKHRLFIKYTLYGMGTTVINITVYFWLTHIFGDRLYQLWNVISWLFAVLYSFFVNEKFVYKIKYENYSQVLKKFFSFMSGRVFSLLVESGILFVAVSVMNFNDRVVKILAGIVVVLINYYFGKKFVFKKTD